MFKTLREILSKAEEREAAVPAFNFNNLEFLDAICRGAAEEGAPVILAATPGAIRYIGLETLVAMARAKVRQYGIEAALHLDHGKDLETVRRALEAGFSSVMFDGSALPYEENARLTAEAVKIAREFGASVEGEIGVLAGAEDDVEAEGPRYTEPAEAERFWKETGVDALAVAVGTSHGAYKFKGEPKIDFERLGEIRRRVGAYLVLHGASSVPQELVAEANALGARLSGAKGVPEEMLLKAVELGVRKVNTDTDLRIAFLVGVRRHLSENPSQIDPRKYLGEGSEEVLKIVKRRIRLLWKKEV